MSLLIWVRACELCGNVADLYSSVPVSNPAAYYPDLGFPRISSVSQQKYVNSPFIVTQTFHQHENNMNTESFKVKIKVH
jgi:hypothetical protein